MNTFQRRVEDFECAHCGAEVTGSGYTNHCPKCLWSKHVDINPGDRLHECGGMMEPIRIEGTAGKYRIRHKCKKCKIERLNDAAEDDSPDALIAIAARSAA